jgi:frataxin-like iron-binding protein CyaY
MDNQEFQDFVKCKLEKIDDQLEKNTEKQNKRYEEQQQMIIRHDEKINVIWAFLFSGFSLLGILTIVLKFVIK